jgi:hypothetical protein
MNPPTFDAKATGDQSKFVLVRDAFAAYPSFENQLYSSLDFSIVVLNFLWWFLFEHYTKNSVLAVGFVYVMERTVRYLRAVLGQKNLVKKAFIDERFMN